MSVGGKTFVLYSIGGDEVLARRVNANEVEKLGSLLRMGAPIGEESRPSHTTRALRCCRGEVADISRGSP